MRKRVGDGAVAGSAAGAGKLATVWGMPGGVAISALVSAGAGTDGASLVGTGALQPLRPKEKTINATPKARVFNGKRAGCCAAGEGVINELQGNGLEFIETWDLGKRG